MYNYLQVQIAATTVVFFVQPVIISVYYLYQNVMQI